MELGEIQSKLEKYNQNHLLQKYSEMSLEDKKKLIEQISNIDFELMKKLYKSATNKVEFEDIDIEPIDYIDKSKMANEEKKKYINRGIAAIKDKELAVITMAGGQGTRLGHNGPKGTFIMPIDSQKSIFELLCDHLKDAVEKYNTFVPWYIMTSEENHEETLEFFETNNYFDYPRNYIQFFKQGKLPMLGEDGKILLTEDGFVKEASDGHGGTPATLKKTGILEQMNEKGYKWIFISGVDNILANLVDPLLIGMAILNKSQILLKSVEKTDPKEKVGVFCKKNKRVGVVEYTEITDEMANMRDNYGSLVYGDLNALLHLIHIDTLNYICATKLPYHTAHKKADYLKSDSTVERATMPNAYKFESFIFDAFELVDKVSVLRVKREEEFAPLKNRVGVDSPETSKKLYEDYLLRKTAIENYQKWLEDYNIDEDTKKELKLISSNDREIKERFYKELDFGTAGLRGIMGAGTNRMNKYTVTKATQGLANYINKIGKEERGVVILYDTRNMSKEFAEQTALCLNANGIKTYIFNNARPIPVLSYAIRMLNAIAGVMITASHNPPEYNGYKVMWEDGAQITSPIDKDIISEVRNIKRYSDIKSMKIEKAKSQKFFQEIGEELENRFLSEVSKQLINNDNLGESKSKIKIVYTPLHGTGLIPVTRILKENGYKNVFVVPEQELPNGNFPTVEFPNPEDPNTFKLALKLAKEIDADICFATDPDCDRLGVQIKNREGKYISLSGNQIAMILLEYIITQRQSLGLMPENPALVSTIVSTNLAKRIAEYNNVAYYETLTGFKYIGKYIKEFLDNNTHNFIFGFEESYGFLAGIHARDKDAVVASALFVEAATYYLSKGLTLDLQLEEISKKYGYYLEETIILTLKGTEGEKQIKAIMEYVRNNMPKKVANLEVVRTRDYLKEEIIDVNTGEKSHTELPNSNVIYLELEQDSWLAMRPSGTEPKIKFYIGSNSESKEKSQKIIKDIIKEVENLISKSKAKSNTIKFRGNRIN